ncbi:uncharacterized protein LOC134834415 [Culicoides brevitarsis]|uniref:uncharacterized protein LOC134834415 n=1 Tax=Culicoides brevitarsis TaxID=469753 RepID=UPI00307B8010
MLKSSISDPTVRVIPSERLREFLKDHVKEKSALPVNVQRFLGIEEKNKAITKTNKTIIQFSPEEQKALRHLNQEDIVSRIEENQEDDSKNEVPSGVEDLSKSTTVQDALQKIEENSVPDTKPNNSLNNSDLKWIYNFLCETRKTDTDTPYLHELLEESELILPENHFVERNPVLEERCKKLRKEQEQREYNKMTKNVDSVRKRDPEDTIGYQMRAINSQLIAILQFLFSVAAGFAFGFVGIALIVGDLDFGFRLLLGIMFALIIALAEIYFLAKKLNEDYEVKTDGPTYNDYYGAKETTTKTKKDN